MDAEQDLRTVVREFKASVAADLASMHRRLDEFTDEFRDRLRTTETAVMNELRDLSQRGDRRADRIEARLDAFETQVETRFQGVDARFDGIDARFEQVEASLERIERALGGR